MAAINDMEVVTVMIMSKTTESPKCPATASNPGRGPNTVYATISMGDPNNSNSTSRCVRLSIHPQTGEAIAAAVQAPKKIAPSTTVDLLN